MKLTVNKERLELAKKAQDTIIGNSIHCHMKLTNARHENDKEAVSLLTETRDQLLLISELLETEITRMESLLEQNWKLN